MADLLGVKRTTYANWEKDTEPSMTIIRSIADTLKVPFDTLLHGENDKNAAHDEQRPYHEKRRDIKNSDNNSNSEIPVYFGNTRAGTIQVYSDDPDMQTPVGHLPSTLFPGCNHGEKVNGDSMYPLICNQAYVIGKIIDKKGFIWGEKYVIHTSYGQNIVKFVHPSEQGPAFIKIVSLNKKIPPQDIPMDEITFVCRVSFIVNPS